MNNPPIMHEELQSVVGRALVDPTYCAGLLNSHRAECLAEFDLKAEERAAASAIQADDIQSFALQLDRWIRDGHARASLIAPFIGRAGPRSVASAA